MGDVLTKLRLLPAPPNNVTCVADPTTVAAPVEPLLAAVDVVAEPLSRAVAAGAASSGRPAAAPPPVVAPPLPDDAELRQLRGEMATLRQDLTRLSGELADLHETIDLMLVTRYVAPRYNEPMELAQKGYDARRIAAASGISLPEAELVVALSRKDFGNDANLEGSDDGPASADAAAAR